MQTSRSSYPHPPVGRKVSPAPPQPQPQPANLSTAKPHIDSLPFNSFHLAADYNLYHLKANLTSPIPLSSLPPRLYVHRYSRPTTIKGRSAPTSSYASDNDEEDSRAALFTSRAFHSSAATPASPPTSSSLFSHSQTLPAGVDGCCLHVPRWYYEEQLRQLVERMEHAHIDNQSMPLAATHTATRATTASTAVHRLSGRSRVSHSQLRPLPLEAASEEERRTSKRVRLPTPIATVQQQHFSHSHSKRAASSTQLSVWEDEATKQSTSDGQSDTDKSDSATGTSCSGGSRTTSGGVVSVSAGMNVRRVKLLEMARVQQRGERPHSSPPLIAAAHNDQH